MNLMTSISSIGRFVGGTGRKLVTKVQEAARRSGFEGELSRVEDAVTQVRTAVTEASDKARDAAADALARAGAGLGAKAAAGVGSQNNAYRRLLSFIDTPEKRLAWQVGAVVVTLALVLYLVLRKR